MDDYTIGEEIHQEVIFQQLCMDKYASKVLLHMLDPILYSNNTVNNVIKYLETDEVPFFQTSNLNKESSKRPVVDRWRFTLKYLQANKNLLQIFENVDVIYNIISNINGYRVMNVLLDVFNSAVLNNTLVNASIQEGDITVLEHPHVYSVWKHVCNIQTIAEVQEGDVSTTSTVAASTAVDTPRRSSRKTRSNSDLMDTTASTRIPQVHLHNTLVDPTTVPQDRSNWELVTSTEGTVQNYKYANISVVLLQHVLSNSSILTQWLNSNRTCLILVESLRIPSNIVFITQLRSMLADIHKSKKMKSLLTNMDTKGYKLLVEFVQ